MLAILARLWAAPYSVLGLLLAPFFRARTVRYGVLWCEGAAWPGKLGWRYRAITFGHVVLAVDRLDTHTVAHELIHVRQYERWGPFMVPAYLLAALWNLVKGRPPYLENAFEVAARTEAPALALTLARHEAPTV
ncbi:MAG TPA: signal peptide prediction [Actinomycetota bacterium]|nr:signal peptide prediction [Actinomycetota bacterium]